MKPSEKLKREARSRGVTLNHPTRKEPLWKGPEQDGVTYSLLSKWLVCRERARLLLVEGLRPAGSFNHRLEYGNMWHVCEEALARGNDPTRGSRARDATPLWQDDLLDYAMRLAKNHPLQQEQVDHWYNVCKVQFPLYADYWGKHPDVTARRPLLQEQVFDVLYKLSSGRKVRLRGKWDSVDLVRSSEIWLQENKTKGDVREAQIRQQLKFDLQTMLYLVALEACKGGCYSKLLGAGSLAGVRYNVVRRPLSGGKGSIVRHKPTKSNPAGESKASFYNRLKTIIEGDSGSYFMRWNVEVSPEDVTKFRRECLDPILENLCVWWDWVSCSKATSVPAGCHHWRTPFGVNMGLFEGGSTDLDGYLEDGSTVGLTRADNLFPEL
jgi:hypothetical protein